jgi:hypothetical protein
MLLQSIINLSFIYTDALIDAKRTTITTKAAAVSKSKDLDTEIIDTSNSSSNNRSDKLLSISKENALTICDYIIAMKRGQTITSLV